MLCFVRASFLPCTMCCCVLYKGRPREDCGVQSLALCCSCALDVHAMRAIQSKMHSPPCPVDAAFSPSSRDCPLEGSYLVSAASLHIDNSSHRSKSINYQLVSKYVPKVTVLTLEHVKHMPQTTQAFYFRVE